MRKLLTSIFAISTLFVFAQAPQGINYQGVARNLSGTLLANQNVGIKLDLHQGSSGGSVVFSETHNKTTNSFGLFNLTIGSVNTPAFTSINWSNGSYFLEVSVDPSGGSSYISVGTQQFMSVPYALYAQSSGNASPTPTITINAPNTITSSAGSYTINVPATISYSAGTGIDITSGVISNTAIAVPPSIVGTGATTVTSSGNTFTVNTPASQTYSAGTGIDITAGIISNTATAITPTITSTGIAVVTPTTGNTFNVDVPVPVLGYNNGTNVLSLSQGTTVTTATLVGTGTNTTSIVGSGLAIVTPTTGSTFTVSVPNPTLSIGSGSLSISGGNSVAIPSPSLTINSNSLTINGPGGNTVVLPSASTTSLTQGANITVTGSAPNYTVSAPNYSISLPGGNTVQITNGVSTSTAAIATTSLTLTGVNNNILSAGGNTVGLNTYSAGTGITISGTAPNYTLASPNQSLAISGNSLSISGSNTITLPASVITGTGSGIATVTTSVNNFTVNVPSPTYTAASGVLSFGGTNTIVVTPTLSLTGTTLTSGASTNSVNLSSLSVWSNSVGVLYPTTLTNSVGIGTSGPISGKVEISHSASAANPHLNFVSPSAVYGRVKYSNTGQANYFSTEYINDGSGINEAFSINQFNGTNSKPVLLINGQRMTYVNALNYPLSTFHVMTSTATASGGISSEGFAQAGQLNIVRNNNAGAGVRTAAIFGDDLGKINFAGYDGGGFGDGAKIYAKAAENVTGSNKGTELIFAAVPTGTNTNKEVFKINGSNKLEIITSLLIPTNSGAGKVLTSDAVGNVSWQNTSNTSPWIQGAGIVTQSILGDKVGIGTNSPSAQLTIANTYTAAEGLFVDNNSNNNGIRVYQGGSGNGFFAHIGTASGGVGFTGMSSANAALFSGTSFGAGRAAEFYINNAANNSEALYATTNGGGSALKVVNTNTLSGTGIEASTNAGIVFVGTSNSNGSVIFANNTSTGRSIEAYSSSNSAIYAANNSSATAAIYVNNSGGSNAIYATNNSSTTAAIYATNSGSYDGLMAHSTGGRAIYAQSNSTGGYSALEAIHYGSGTTIMATKPNGASGSVGVFSNNNTANGSDAVIITNSGAASSLFANKPAGSTSGNVARFENLGVGNTADAVFVNNAGTGAAIHAVVSNTNTGTAGLFDGNVITNGNVTIPATKNYKYASPKTDYCSISALSFNTEGTYNRSNLSGGIYIVNGTAGTQGNLYSGVNLPNGAVVTGVDAYVLDNDGVAGRDIAYVQLWRQDGAVGTGFGNAVNMAQTPGTTVTSSAIVKLSTTTISNSTIDNSLYTYYLRVGTVQASPNLMLFKVVITYTIINVD